MLNQQWLEIEKLTILYQLLLFFGFVLFFSFIVVGLNRNWRNEIRLVEEIEPVLQKQNEVAPKNKKLEEQ